MALLFSFTICINISYFLGHWLYKGQRVYSIINIGFNHVDTDMECLHVSMGIQTQSVPMSPCVSPCGYGHRVSPCGYRHGVYYELHGDFHVDMDSHMEISM